MAFVFFSFCKFSVVLLLIQFFVNICHVCPRLKKLAEEFYKHVNPAEVAEELQLDFDLVDCLCSYWILKRKVGTVCVSCFFTLLFHFPAEQLGGASSHRNMGCDVRVGH
jgi:hypothetical protein